MTVLGCPVSRYPPLSCLRGFLLNAGHALHLKANLGGETRHDVINRLLRQQQVYVSNSLHICLLSELGASHRAGGSGQGAEEGRVGRFWHFLELLRPPSFSPRVVFTTCRGHEEMTEGKTNKHGNVKLCSLRAEKPPAPCARAHATPASRNRERLYPSPALFTGLCFYKVQEPRGHSSPQCAHLPPHQATRRAPSLPSAGAAGILCQ